MAPLIAAIALAVITDLKLFSGGFLRIPFLFTEILFSYALLLHCVPPDAAHIGKGLALSFILYIASCSDAKTHEIPDSIHVLLLIDGLILLEPRKAVTGFFIVSVLFYLIAVLTHGGIGGGDIKLTAAAGWVLGPVGIVTGTVIGCSLLVLTYLLIYFRRDTRHKRYALAPCLSIGCFAAYLLTSQGGL
jgi:Type IV leader peptidase family.